MAAVGRPRKIKSSAEFVKLAQKYFDDCDAREVPPFVTGIALAVGLSSRKTLMEYEGRAEFRNAVRAAKMRCELSIAELTAAGKCPAPFGIFTLKQHGWTDRQIVAHEGEIRHIGVANVPKTASPEVWLERYGQYENGQPKNGAVN